MTFLVGTAVRRGGCAAVLAVLVAGTAQAQFPAQMRAMQQHHDQRQQQRQQQFGWPNQQGMQGMQPMQEPIKASGTIEAMDLGRIHMVTTAGEGWLLQLMPTTQLEATGKATAQFLAPGQCISFVAKVDKRHAKVDEKVSKLTIVTPDANHMLGAYPEGTAGAEAAELGAAKDPGVPGAGPQGPPGANNNLNPANPAPNKAASRAAKTTAGAKGAARPAAKGAAARASAPAEETFEIVGRISRIKNGELTISVPNGYFKSSLRIELAEQPEIDVHLRGTDVHNWIQKGDKIDVTAVKIPDRTTQAMQQMGTRVAHAVQVTIELSQTLGATEDNRKGARRPATTRAKGEPAAKPEAEQPPQGQAQQ